MKEWAERSRGGRGGGMGEHQGEETGYGGVRKLGRNLLGEN